MSDIDNSARNTQSSAQSVLSKVQRFTWTFRKWWWLLLITVGIGVAWVGWQDSKKAPSYQSTGRMMVTGRISLPEGNIVSEELANFYGTQCKVMESVEVRQGAATRVESMHPELRSSSVWITANQEKGTSLFDLTAIGDEPNYTQAFLDACMEEYIRVVRKRREMLVAGIETRITDELVKLERDIELSTQELFDFVNKTDVGFLEEEGNSASKFLAQLNQKVALLKMEYNRLNAINIDQHLERSSKGEEVENRNDSDEESRPAPLGSVDGYLKAKQQVQLTKAEKERRSRFMRPKHPIIKKLDEEIAYQERVIALFREQAATQLANQREEKRLEIENVENSAKEASAHALEIAGKLNVYHRLKEKVERAKESQKSLQGGGQTIKVGHNIQEDTLQVMDHASIAESTRPGFVKDIGVGALSGLLVGAGIVFLIGLLDDRITSAAELRERFPEPMLGHIPHEPSQGRVSMLKVDNKQGIFAESYRNLRSTLHFMSLEEPRPRAFLITSAVPGEGKSTLAVNLGITVASGGARTLLVDADLRKGLLHSYFNVESTPGLIEVLNGEINWKEALVETSVKGLFLLPRGKSGGSPGEYFLSGAADRFLREVYAADFDRIIFDSAPVLATDDTACLAPKIDATLFVIRAEASSMRLTRSALDALEKRQVNVLGLILNAANLRSSEYYYYQKYGDYYAESGSEKK